MKVPPWVKPAFWGVVVGAVGIMILGFAWWGWVLGSTAERMAKERADSMAVSLLAPVCVDRFMAQPDKWAEFQSSSWRQQEIVEKSGWATIPGSSAANSALAKACVAGLAKQKI
jgi:hypothetical protein